MSIHKWKDLRNERVGKERQAENDRWVEREILEMDLRALRKHRRFTQEQLAAAVEMAQGDLSKLEKRNDHRLSTLRRIVEALGGELEITARFDGERVTLTV